MGLESYKRYQDLNDIDYFPKRIGFAPGVEGGDINRLNARINLAKSFQGLKLDGIGENTVMGYNALFQIVLTHSVLERFAEIFGHSRNFDTMSKPMLAYGSESVVANFFAKDKKGRLFDFLSKRTTDKNLKAKFADCQSGESSNVAHISVVVRHIFAHGHLCANVSGMSPRAVHAACMSVSDFLLRFMDAEFTCKIDACYARIAEKQG